LEKLKKEIQLSSAAADFSSLLPVGATVGSQQPL
jgi:hypothetical protein